MKRNKILYAACIVLFYLLFEGCSYAVLAALEHVKGIYYTPISYSLSPDKQLMARQLIQSGTYMNYYAYDSDLGWNILPSGRHSTLPYMSNSQSLRADHVYTEFPEPGRVRIAAFGDSFVHGDEVSIQDTWETQLENLSSNTFEIINYGVSAYGLDQAFLRYKKEGELLHPHAVLIGISPVMLTRNGTHYSLFLNIAASTKPRFYIESGSLILHNNPIQSHEEYSQVLEKPEQFGEQLSANDLVLDTRYSATPLDILPSVRLLKILLWQYTKIGSISLYNMHTISPQISALSLAIYDAFAQEVHKNKGQVITVFFPIDVDVNLVRAGKEPTYSNIYTHCVEQGYVCIDLMYAINTIDEDIPIFLERGHYTPYVHLVVAKYLYLHLQDIYTDARQM